MVFLGRLIAWGLVIVGAVRIGAGFWVATAFPDPADYAAATARYLGSGTSGEWIDSGLYMIAAGVAFGLLTRIASRRQGSAPND